MPDIFIKCVDCQQDFEHTERDQEFFAERKFTPPKRCRSCRNKKKLRFDDKKPRSDDEFVSKEY